MNIHKRKASAAAISIVSNATLVLFKFVIGVLMGSVAVISEAIHSGIDLVASVIAWVAVRKAGKPADREHPYGHGKVENLSGAIEAILIFAAAAWIIYEAVKKLTHLEPIAVPWLGIVVMGTSTVANILVSRMLFRVGEETDSIALKADAWHLRTDVYTSAGVMAAMTIIWIAGLIWPDKQLYWIDPVVAMSVALLILGAAYRLTMDSVRDLLDESLPPTEERWIKEYLRSLAPRVHGFHRLRTRKAGAQRFIEFHLLVEGRMSVEISHAISDEVLAAIRDRFHGAYITVHIEPCDGVCKPFCVEGCLLDEQERNERHRSSAPPSPIASSADALEPNA